MNKTLFACTAALFCSVAHASPGEYWQFTSKTEMAGMPYPMPATTQKICVGKGDAKDPRQAPQDQTCKITDVKFSGNKTSWKIRCDRNGEVLTGNGEQVTATDSYHGTMHFAGKSGGRDMEMTQNYSAKRVGGSCDTEEMARQLQRQLCGKDKCPSDAQRAPAAKAPPQAPAADQAESGKTESGQSSDSVLEGAKKLKGMFGF